MEGLVAAHRRMDAGSMPAVIHAAAVAYRFTFLHPFEGTAASIVAPS
ncbi:MAG: hypothetical protein WCK00_07075 [Deltaproteobacteria bacterium]